jgi:hypothetical protein
MGISDLFTKKERDTKNTYMAGAGALAAIPLANYGSSYLASDMKSLGTGHLRAPIIEALKQEVLGDAELAKNMSILRTEGTSSPALRSMHDKSKYIPGMNLDSLKNVIREGGFSSVDGDKIPVSDFIKKVRNSGGYVVMPGTSIHGAPDIADLAHELGHARALSSSSSRAGSRSLHSIVQSLGRSNPLALATAATAASLLQDDPDSAYAYAPAALVAATQVPVLKEEYIASKKGYDALKKLEASGMLEKGLAAAARGKYTKALGTYGLGALGVTAVPLLAALARSRYNTMVPVSDSTDEDNLISPSLLNTGKTLAIGAGGAAAGLLAAKALGPAALEHIAKPLKGYLDELVANKMAKGQAIDEAVDTAKRLNKIRRQPTTMPATQPYTYPYLPVPTGTGAPIQPAYSY